MSELDELVIRTQNEDIKAFETLILNFGNDLYRIAQTRLDNNEDINDAIQETTIFAYKSIKKLQNPEYFKTWLIKILINECNKIHKKNKKHFNIFQKLSKNKPLIEYDDSHIDNIENKIELEKILNKLTYEERICITLFYNDKYSISEISDILSVSPNTIKSRITRVKEKIKKYYDGGVNNEASKK